VASQSDEEPACAWIFDGYITTMYVQYPEICSVHIKEK
jgi:hypothetical protein